MPIAPKLTVPYRTAMCVIKINFLTFQPKHMLWVLRQPSHSDGSYLTPKTNVLTC